MKNSKHTPGPIKRITNNTGTVDIDQHSIGLDVSYEELTDLKNKRGLHIQIRHNRDKATFNEANNIARLIAAAPEMLAYLENLLTFEGKVLDIFACNSIRALIAEARGKS